jgi:hypothetical protein
LTCEVISHLEGYHLVTETAVFVNETGQPFAFYEAQDPQFCGVLDQQKETLLSIHMGIGKKSIRIGKDFDSIKKHSIYMLGYRKAYDNEPPSLYKWNRDHMDTFLDLVPLVEFASKKFKKVIPGNF